MALIQNLKNASWLFNLLGLKAIYQFIYIIFNIFIIKKLSIAEYGVYSYIIALVVYFSSIPLLGLPLYLQKNTAKKSYLDARYFFLAATLALVALFLAFFIMPHLCFLEKIAVLIIITFNCLLAIPVSINDGRGKYFFQYQLLFFSSMWMIACIAQVLLGEKNITLFTILNYWVINALVSLVAIVWIIHKLTASMVFEREPNKSYPLLLLDLLLLYSISIPDGFVRFYDRFLAHKFLNDDFLGDYSFNLMLVTTIYAFFIRPINSILFTQLAKVMSLKEAVVQPIKKYYCFGACIYTFCFIIYYHFSEQLLFLLGLSKYNGTKHIFVVCFMNAILYFIAIPFTSLIALSDRGPKKFAYCMISLTIFNLPLALMLMKTTTTSFFIGFNLAYLMNLILCAVFEYQYVGLFISSLIKDSYHALKYPVGKLQKLLDLEKIG